MDASRLSHDDAERASCDPPAAQAVTFGAGRPSVAAAWRDTAVPEGACTARASANISSERRGARPEGEAALALPPVLRHVGDTRRCGGEATSSCARGDTRRGGSDSESESDSDWAGGARGSLYTLACGSPGSACPLVPGRGAAGGDGGGAAPVEPAAELAAELAVEPLALPREELRRPRVGEARRLPSVLALASARAATTATAVWAFLLAAALSSLICLPSNERKMPMYASNCWMCWALVTPSRFKSSGVSSTSAEPSTPAASKVGPYGNFKQRDTHVETSLASQVAMRQQPSQARLRATRPPPATRLSGPASGREGQGC